MKENNFIQIGNRRIGLDYPPFVIAEIGINHEGSLKVAKEMVDAAHRAGVECVKHQTHIVDDEMSGEAKKVIPGNADVSIYDIMKRCSLNEQDEIELKDYVESKGMIFISTPFSRAASHRLEKMNVLAYKIGSGECNNYPLIKHIGKAIGATSWTSWGKVGVPWSEKEMIGGGGTYMLKGDFGHILLDAAKSFRPEQILMAQISTSKRGGGIGSKVMNAIKSYADQKGLPITIYKVTNQKFFDKFEWLEKTGADTYEYKLSSFAEASVTEEVSLPKDIFHMKNRLLKVKKITDAMGNRPIMFRSFVYDADRIGKIIKKVTNDSGRKIKTGSNQKQQEVLQKLGVNNPTFANLAAGKHADVRRTSLEDGVAGLQNIFIPISNEIYYSDAVEDLGMGRPTGGNNISLQSDFDVDKAVASYKKGWPPAGFDNEIIVDTDKYYLLNLQSFLLELTSPDIKDQIKRLKKEYDKSYSSNASKNQVDDILKDLFKTKIITYSNISRWIESVAIPFVDMLGASSVQENFKDGKNPGRKGLSKRVGIPANATLAQLEKITKNSDGEKRRMAQWQLNMRRGKNK